MDAIRIVVEGIAVPQPRPRFARFGNMVKTVSNPQKHPITAYKQHIAIAASLAYQGHKPLEGPVKCVLTFILPRPVDMCWKTKEMQRSFHWKKPDPENLAKGVLDALTGIIWIDDGQVSILEIGKVIADGVEKPRTIIIVSKL